MLHRSLFCTLFAGALALTAHGQCGIKDRILHQWAAADQAAAEAETPDTVLPSEAENRSDMLRDLLSFERLRIGGYGEIVAARKDYGLSRHLSGLHSNSRETRTTIALPRLVFTFDYKLSSRWLLGTALEIKSGGTGTAVELENAATGAYKTEVEKGGEIALEQFHLTRLIHPAFNLRLGHMVVPVGLTNYRHEPTDFFGTVRPESETTLLPTTWHETGIAAFGEFGRGLASFDYQALVVTGLNANGFDRDHWVRSGKQGLFAADQLNSPAFVARLNWYGLEGLRLGASVYHCANTLANADQPTLYANIPAAALTLVSADGHYNHRYLSARGTVLWGALSQADKLSALHRSLPDESPYTRSAPIASRTLSYGIEAGAHLRAISGSERFPDVTPFVRYAYYNPQERTAGIDVPDPRLKTQMWVFGLNYRVAPGVLLKADYTTRRMDHGRFASENEIAVGVAFNAWF